MTSRRNRFAALGLGAALTLGLGVPALAQGTSTPTSQATASASQKARPTKAEREAARTARETEFAARLGISVAKITEANKAQAKAEVDKALAAGTINAAQAGAYKTLIDNNTDGRGGIRLPHAESATAPTQAERDAARTARLTEYVARLGVTVDAYTKAQKEQAKADVDKAVTAGRLTAAQATDIKARIDSSKGGFGGPEGPEGPGGFRGHRGHGDHGGGRHDGPGMGGGRNGDGRPGSEPTPPAGASAQAA